jgi:hypothetical protein
VIGLRRVAILWLLILVIISLGCTSGTTKTSETKDFQETPSVTSFAENDFSPTPAPHLPETPKPTINPRTTSPKVLETTTQPPTTAWATSTTSTITTTTVWIPQPTEVPVTEQSFLSVEPIRIIETLDSPIIVQMDHWDAVKIEDAYIYITGDFDGCSGEVWWYFNIYRDTPEGGVWEGKTQSYDLYQIHSNQDISPQIHEVSDALNDYTIVVKKWDVQEGLTIEISP